MLSAPARSAARRTASTSTSTRALSSSSSAPDDLADHRLRLRLLRTAAYGTYELASSPADPRPAKGYIAQAGFRPTSFRRGAELTRLGRSKTGRGHLVELDDRQVEASLARSKTAAPRTELLPHPRRLAGAQKQQVLRSPGAHPARAFTTSAVGRLRLAEESLADLDGDLATAEGGLWDDADVGDGGKGKSRARELKAGDFVETSRNGVPASGIYVSRSPATARRILLLSTSGDAAESSLDDVTFVSPSLVPTPLAQQVVTAVHAALGQEDTWDPSLPAVIDALQALRRLEIAVEAETQQLVARGANDIFRILHAPVPPPSSSGGKGKVASPPRSFTPPKSVTIVSALAALRVPAGADAPPSRLLAMHRLLIAQPEHFIADEVALRATGRFDLRSKAEADRFETVREWVRHRSEELEAWAEKCAKVREWARGQGAGEGAARGDQLEKLVLPAERANVPTFRWSKTDLTIFAFLRDALAAERLLQSQPHMAIAPSLLKHVDAASSRAGFAGWGTERDVRKARIRAFLAEVGVVAPWENWAAHERVTGLAEWDETGLRVERALTLPRPLGKKKAPRTLPSNEMYPSDPHDAVRHDFGAAAVYTIDDPSASELDDGISLAPGPASASGGRTWWVHVHVADPTALLHPEHLFARLARVRDHTEYFPEKTWPMLPESFTVGNQLSLGALGAGKEQHVLSLGVRIDEESGDVLESEVKAGVVRDVRRLTYGAVDQALGYTPPPKGRVLRSWADLPDEEAKGAPRSARPTDDATLETDAHALSDLRMLHALASKLLQRRVASSALFWQFPAASVSVAPTPLAPHFHTSPTPTFYAGAPRVSLQLPSDAARSGHASHADSPAQLLVSEMMVAANRAAARFASERELPAPFRTQAAPAGSPADLEAVLALRDPRTGQAPAVEVLKRGIDFLPGATTPTPGPHWPMGIDATHGYLKVTSPLRRYSDLFAHYQLKSALLPTSSSSSPGAFAGPFPLWQVQAHIDGSAAAGKARHRLDSAASAFWALWVLRPYLSALAPSSPASSPPAHVNDDETLSLLAGGLTALALRTSAHSAVENVHIQPVLIPQLGLRGTLQVDRAAEAAAVGEEVPVRVVECVLGARSRVVVALRK
ncbi:3'-5' RNA exonuclease complex component [Rhodotorula kratochvilovae]